MRRALHHCMVELLPLLNQAVSVLLPLADEISLEKYYDVYDINEQDIRDARLAYTELEFEDNESLRVLKILVARFHTLRKAFLCCLLALEADGGKPDFLRWGTAVDEIHIISSFVGDSEERMRQILTEEQCKSRRWCRFLPFADRCSLSSPTSPQDSANASWRAMALATT